MQARQPHLYTVIGWIKAHEVRKEFTARIIPHAQTIKYTSVRSGSSRDENRVFAVDGEDYATLSVRHVYSFFQNLLWVAQHQAMQHDLDVLLQWVGNITSVKMEVKVRETLEKVEQG